LRLQQPYSNHSGIGGNSRQSTLHDPRIWDTIEEQVLHVRHGSAPRGLLISGFSAHSAPLSSLTPPLFLIDWASARDSGLAHVHPPATRVERTPRAPALGVLPY
jgi:hypothetical protein